MLKREITYEDFDGKKSTEILYFNLTKSELIELEVGYEDGLDEMIRKIIKTNDRAALIREFKRILLLSYGQKSEDGKRFVKSAELREAFVQTAAYDTMFMELATSADAATAFIRGILPQDMAAEIARLENETPTPPTLPAPPAPNQ